MDGIKIKRPENPVSQSTIEEFVGDLLRRLLSSKRYILGALEIPYIPLLPFSTIDNRILRPMRWGVAGTMAAAQDALSGCNAWNLSGGYHHASKASAEGFCIYNDIGITIQHLIKEKQISPNEEIIIIDIDAHHGNGNAHVFLEHKNITILDIYNNDIYPASPFTKERININIPLNQGTAGKEYLAKLNDGLSQIKKGFKMAFIISGTDVLKSDTIGGLQLSINDCVARDHMVIDKLQSLSTPAVFLGGGGYGKESATAIASNIANLYKK